MGTRCFMVEKHGNGTFTRADGSDQARYASAWQLPPGAMWWDNHPKGLPAQPISEVPQPHLVVVVARATVFCTDCLASDVAKGKWTRTGSPPDVTVSPSIDAGERFHGHLIDGMLS